MLKIKKFLNIINSLNKVILKFNIDILFPAHPRTKKLINTLKIKLNKRIKIIEPLNYINFLTLIRTKINNYRPVDSEKVVMKVLQLL